MKITFITNYVHHHQIPVADEFYRMLGQNYSYIATTPLPNWLIKGGYDPTLTRNYIVRPYESLAELELSRKLLDDSDIVIAGVCPDNWLLNRKKNNKIVFYYSERIYKKRIAWLKIPYHLFFNYQKFGRYPNTYMLCASAYASHDYMLTHSLIGKCFKWGYMTAVDKEVNAYFSPDVNQTTHKIMWCGRFIDWKHPELPIKLACRLKQNGYNFHIDMYGDGVEKKKIIDLIKKTQTESYVSLKGNLPNQSILEEMRNHEIFLFTSDRNEGWGAVLNEAMSNGCGIVASNEIGSVPYLVKNGVNGIIFRSCNMDSLNSAVCTLLDSPSMLAKIRNEALRTMREEWSPKVAAENFLDLAQHVLAGKLDSYNRMEGPASWD